ncbi:MULTISPECIES: hypothetical protein [unclassified Methylobacterium]|uniref:hypothetical protein n=1 Tax=unclassified Methylobacterium TaxID=2615210 RepID=UPI00226AFBC2|nr:MULTISPECIES: hypothetical protein [unclassified Methylobacterium]
MSDRERHRRAIEKLTSRSTKSLSKSIKDKTISEEDAKIAQETLLSVQIGAGLAKAFRNHLIKSCPEAVDQFDVVLSTCMKGMFFCGSLIGTTPGRSRSRTKKAREARSEGRDLHLEAIRYALSQPPSYPFQKNRRGTSAIAKRASKAANQWLLDNGHKSDLTDGAIQKRIERDQKDLPPTDTWLK